MTKHNDATWYDTFFKAWPTAMVGGKPTLEALHTVHMLGLRPGKQALANAMALRPQGVTGSEIVMVCGAPQLNRMRGLIGDALVKRDAAPMRNGHTVYKLTLTPKGAKRVASLEARAATAAAQGELKGDKPVKAKAKRVSKPRKAKVTPATVEAPSEAQQPQGDSGQQPAPQA